MTRTMAVAVLLAGLVLAGCGGGTQQGDRTRTTYPITVISTPLPCGSPYGCGSN